MFKHKSIDLREVDMRILDVHVVPDNNLINDTKNLGFHILSVQAYNGR